MFYHVKILTLLQVHCRLDHYEDNSTLPTYSALQWYDSSMQWCVPLAISRWEKKLKKQHDFSLKSYGESTLTLPMSWEAELEEPDTLSFDNYSKRVCGAKGALFYSNCPI